MSKSKNLKFISLVTVFCVVIAYFSVLSPTTAYFTQTDTQTIDVSFYNLSASQTISQTALNFNLKAATKFEDFDELLFDDVVYSQFVKVTNTGDVRAKVYLTVDVPQASVTNGLKYIVFTTATVTSPSEPSFYLPAGSDDNKGDIKEYIESSLSSFNSSTFRRGVTLEDAVSVLDTYNTRTRTFNTAPLLQPQQSLGFQIYFWAEYGNIAGTISDTSAISSYSYTANVTVSAHQYDNR
ncbi:MAG: hypothetical protein IJS17_07280 [Clostridia bacterium]|nr:hypothetical protein [Clostridia bacterium]